MMEVSDFAMEHVFNKIITEDGDVVYWRDCVLRNDMHHGEQGYVIVFSNGDCHHTYHYPPDFIRSATSKAA